MILMKNTLFPYLPEQMVQADLHRIKDGELSTQWVLHGELIRRAL